MISQANHSASGKNQQPAWHKKFLEMLPHIGRQAWIRFCGLSLEARLKVVADALVHFVRLVELGKEDIAYRPTDSPG